MPLASEDCQSSQTFIITVSVSVVISVALCAVMVCISFGIVLKKSKQAWPR